MDMDMDGKVEEEEEKAMEMEVNQELDEFLNLRREETTQQLHLLIDQANAEVAPREHPYFDDDDDDDDDAFGLGPRLPNNIRSSYHHLLGGSGSNNNNNNDSVLQFAISRCHMSISTAQDFILNACFSFPQSLPDRLPSLTKFCIWLFFFDDLFDADSNRLGTDPQAASILVLATLSSLRTSLGEAEGTMDIHGIDESRRVDGDLVEDVKQGAALWWGEFQRFGMEPDQQRRFLRAFTSYLAAIHRKTRHRFSGTLPSDLRSYAQLRADASCVFCFNVLLEFSMGINVMSDLPGRLPPQLRRALESLGRNAVLETVWFNDLRSLPKEMAEGDIMNLIPYLYVRERRAMEEAPEEQQQLGMVEMALKLAGKMVSDCRVEARRLVADIHTELFSVGATPHNIDLQEDEGDVKLYVTAIEAMVSGLQLWHDQAMLYHPVQHEERRRRNMMHPPLAVLYCIGHHDS